MSIRYWEITKASLRIRCRSRTASTPCWAARMWIFNPWSPARWWCALAIPTCRFTRTSGRKLVELAKTVDAIIYVGGICAELEREFMNVPFEGFNHGDRTRIELPQIQTDFLKAIQATGKPLVFVNCSGSAMAMPWEAEHLSAIRTAWYPGQSEGGKAVAEILFGDVKSLRAGCPSRFIAPPPTCRRSLIIPCPIAPTAISKASRSFAFGHGLSYTQFKVRRRATGQGTSCHE